MKLTTDEWNKIFHMADLLGWEIDRMSSGGVEVYNELIDLLEKISKRGA